jgi:peptidoglycan/LPS O-acetylase OafA/YrhL
VYLLERGAASRTFVAILLAAVLGEYYWMIARHQPPYIGVHFAALAVLRFAAAWAARRAFRLSHSLHFLSSLKLSVYLFHVWVHDYARKALTLAGVPSVAPPLARGAIFGTCYVMVRAVEKPAIRIGAAIAARLADDHWESGTGLREIESK